MFSSLFGISQQTTNESFHSCDTNEIDKIEKKHKAKPDKSGIFRGQLLQDRKFKDQAKKNLEKALQEAEEHKKPAKSPSQTLKEQHDRERVDEEIRRKCLELFAKGNKFQEERDRRMQDKREQEVNFNASMAEKLKEQLKKTRVKRAAKAESTSQDHPIPEQEQKKTKIGTFYSHSPSPMNQKVNNLTPSTPDNQQPKVVVESEKKHVQFDNVKKISAHEKKSKDMLLQMKERLASTIVSQRSTSKPIDSDRKHYYNPETERRPNKSKPKVEPELNFMKATESKKHQIEEKCDQLESISSRIYTKINGVTPTGKQIMKKNKNVKNATIVNLKLQKLKEMEKKKEKIGSFEHLKKNTNNYLSKQFAEDQERITYNILQQRQGQEDSNDQFLAEIKYKGDTLAITEDFLTNHLSYTEFSQVMEDMHFILSEDERLLGYHLFTMLKRNPSLECVNKKDHLNVLLFIQGYKFFQELFFNERNVKENDPIWEVMRKNRLNSLKKTSTPDTFTFKPKVNNNQQVEHIKPQQRCQQWNEQKKEKIEQMKTEKEQELQRKEQEMLNHKLQINSKIIKGKFPINTKLQEYIEKSRIERRKERQDEQIRSVSGSPSKKRSGSNKKKDSKQNGGDKDRMVNNLQSNQQEFEEIENVSDISGGHGYEDIMKMNFSHDDLDDIDNFKI